MSQTGHNQVTPDTTYLCHKRVTFWLIISETGHNTVSGDDVTPISPFDASKHVIFMIFLKYHDFLSFDVFLRFGSLLRSVLSVLSVCHSGHNRCHSGHNRCHSGRRCTRRGCTLSHGCHRSRPDRKPTTFWTTFGPLFDEISWKSDNLDILWPGGVSRGTT